MTYVLHRSNKLGSMQLSLIPFIVCCLMALQGCDGSPSQAPPDASVMKSFQDNRSEFDFWRKVFDRRDQNCRIETDFGFARIDSLPCDVPDFWRLNAFMRKANIEYIEARTQFAYPLRDYRPVLFGLYASGTFRHGEIKGVYYLPYYQGQLTDDLDKYNRALIKPDKEPPNGTWYRKLDDNWYLAYMAD